MQMSTSAIVISIVGVISSMFTLSMNIFLLNKVFGKTRKKEEMVMFYYRFAIDVALGALVAAFLTFVVAYCVYSEEFREFHNFIFYLALPASNVGAVRSIVTLTITIERNLAAYTPIFFHNFRLLMPTSLILGFAVSFGLFEDVVLFGLCNFKLDIPLNCAAFGCAINSCFFNYWTTHKSTIFAMTVISSILLCIKLFVLNRFGAKKSAELSRVNRLALLDAGNVCVFDFLPSFIANRWSQTPFFAFQNIGPYGAVAKLFGCAIEAFLVFRTLYRRSEQQKVSEASRSGNNRTLGKRISSVGVIQNA